MTFLELINKRGGLSEIIKRVERSSGNHDINEITSSLEREFGDRGTARILVFIACYYIELTTDSGFPAVTDNFNEHHAEILLNALKEVFRGVFSQQNFRTTTLISRTHGSMAILRVDVDVPRAPSQEILSRITLILNPDSDY